MPPRKQIPIRLFGAPEPERFLTTSDGKMLSETAAIHFGSRKGKDVSKLLAIEKLALDIFQDSNAARAFAVNPEEYFRRYGFPDVKLDLNSQEVKIAMAIGDPLARQAAMKGDVAAFLDAVLVQGIAPSVGLGRFVHVEALVHSSVVVYFIAAVVTYQKIATATAVPVVVVGAPALDKARHMKVLSQIAEHLGDKAFAKQLTSKKAQDLVARYTELVQRKLDPPP